MIQAYYRSKNHDFNLIKGDCVKILSGFDFHFDMIFADPPYFLSNDGISCHSGKMVSVNKGNWDKLTSLHDKHNFNKRWIKECYRLLKDTGTIWICGTLHNIYSIRRNAGRNGHVLQMSFLSRKTACSYQSSNKSPTSLPCA